MRSTLLALLALAVLFALLLVGGIIGNRPPLAQPPGIAKRLHTYLTTNVAETRPDSEFSELRQRRYDLAPSVLFKALTRAVEQLGWRIAIENAAELELRAVVTTRIWRFQDDVLARVKLDRNGGSVLYVRSSSRLGNGDLAANVRHILDLYDGLDRVLKSEGLPVSQAAS